MTSKCHTKLDEQTAKAVLAHDEVVARLRELISFTQNRSELARTLGISRSYLWEVMNNKKKIGFDFAEQLGLEIVFRRTKEARI